MKLEDELPLLLLFMHGEADARIALETASEQTLLWCQAFEGWLSEIRGRFKPTTYRTYLLAWKGFINHSQMMPYQINSSEVQAYIEYLSSTARLAPAILHWRLQILSSFYDWCTQQAIDPSCGPDFNLGAPHVWKKPKTKTRWELMSHEEAQALLDILRNEPWILCSREFAFFTCRLLLGISTRKLVHLKWGQIRADQEGRWIDLEDHIQPAALDDAAWQAIEDYLRAAGRLGPTRTPPPDAYIFAPLKNRHYDTNNLKAEDWDETRCVSTDSYLNTLRTYGLLIGIAPQKLSLPALRYTAISWWMIAGDSEEELARFLGWIKFYGNSEYIKNISAMTKEEQSNTFQARTPASLPVRLSGCRNWDHSIKHGFYANSQPPEDLNAILAEEGGGIDQEIQGMRVLERRLVSQQGKHEAGAVLAGLLDMTSNTAAFIGKLIQAEKQLAQENKTEQAAEQELERLRVYALENGMELDVEAVRAEAHKSNAGMDLTNRRLMEEIAATQLVIRRAFNIGVESEDPKELLRMTTIYGYACLRLAKLLKTQVHQCGRLGDYLDRERERARIDALEELMDWDEERE